MTSFMYFIIYSFIGFILETLYTLLTKGIFKMKKCFLINCLCPVYGVGALLILYTTRKMRDLMSGFFENSPFYEKYSVDAKKVERCDLYDIYYYFKDRLNEIGEFNAVQVFCAIAEFFDVNYKEKDGKGEREKEKGF